MAKKTETKKTDTSQVKTGKKIIKEKKISSEKVKEEKKASGAKSQIPFQSNQKETIGKKTASRSSDAVKKPPARTKINEASAVKPRLRKPPAKKDTAPKPAEKVKTSTPAPPLPIPPSDTLTVESAKFEMTPPVKYPQETAAPFARPRELPLCYGDTKVILLVRDPEWIFAYWEINDDTRDKHNLIRGSHNKTLALRVYDVTGMDFNGSNALRHYDVIINDYAVSWYLRMPEVNRSWCVDMGYYHETKGDFVTLARSNIVKTPAGTISSSVDEEWMRVTSGQYAEILRLSGGLDVKDLRGSEYMMKTISEKLKIQVERSEGISGGIASAHIVKKPSPEKDFWLMVQTDLIVYGASEPDARVKIQGKEISLRNDGTFSIHFSLPDGVQVIPVKAVNAAGDMEREIVIQVKRETR
jgi:hypothetical protein